MPQAVPFENAIDLLDADHKLVSKQFIDYNALCEDEAPAQYKQQLALKICGDLTVHATIEEEIFYPRVQEAIGEGLIEEALEEHAEAKEMIAQIQGMSAEDEGYDDLVKQLGEAINHHVLEEREQIFLQAQYAELDLRAMAVDLFERKKELQAALGQVKPPPKKAEKSPKQKASKKEAA